MKEDFRKTRMKMKRENNRGEKRISEENRGQKSFNYDTRD